LPPPGSALPFVGKRNSFEITIPLLSAQIIGASKAVAHVEVGRKDNWRSLGSGEGRELSVLSATLKGTLRHQGLRCVNLCDDKVYTHINRPAADSSHDFRFSLQYLRRGRSSLWRRRLSLDACSLRLSSSATTNLKHRHRNSRTPQKAKRCGKSKVAKHSRRGWLVGAQRPSGGVECSV
jgi:hypothetical protein